MKRGERRSLRMQNMKRLRDLGLPTDLFSEGFWDREAVAKLRELALLDEFERWWQSGAWDYMMLPFAEIICRWRAEIADPLHFASIGPNPRWLLEMGRASCEWRRLSSGSYRKSWREYRRKQITNKRAAQGKPPPKFKF